MARKPNEKAMIDKIRAIQRGSQANKRCADCPEMGPTYICLNFQTFVCQTCSGIHREFGHKMKGISLSAWTKQEVEDLENGGNERAADIWLARWSRQDCPEPDSSQPDKVRQFLRSKYVEKKWYRASGEDRDDDRKDRRSGDTREPERDRRDADRDREKADRDRRDAERDREKADRDRRDADRRDGDRRDGGRDRDVIERRDDRDRKDRDRDYDRRRDRDEDDGRRDRDRREGDRRRDREGSDDERDRRDRRERRDADRDRDDRDRRENDRDGGRRRERELKEGSRGFYDEDDDRDRDRQNRDRREKEAAPPPPSAAVDFFDPDKPSNAPAVPSGNPFGSSQGGGGDWADFASAKPQAQPPAPAPQPSGGLFDLDFSSGGGTSSGIAPSQPTTSPTGNNMFDLTSGNSSSASANPLVAPAQPDDKFAALQGSLGNLFSQPAPSPFAHLSPQNMGQQGVPGAAPGMPGAFPPGSTPQPSGGAQQQMPAQMQGQMPQMMPGQMPQGGMPMMTPEQMQNMNPQQLAQMQMMLQAQMQMMMQMQMQMQQPGAGGYPGQQPPGAPGSQAQAPLFNDLSAEFQQKASLGDPGTSGQMSANPTAAKPAGGSPFDMFG